ncbi:MAG: DUF4124 domain-containing protein [Gammaproteobacteria bacterium]|nr:DUF4124 domain-containing protein [Gammaproteobacteria bacterium]
MQLLLLIIILLATGASAGIYRWVDESGQVHFGARPPVDVSDSNEVVIRNQAPASEPEPVDRKQARDRYLEQRQRERTEKREAAAKQRQEKAQQEKRCRYARNKLNEYLEHGVLYDRLPNNEKRYLTDQEREQEIAQVRREVDRWCK